MNVRNHIHLTGNLGADPKTIILNNGTTATEFPLATNEYYRDKEGNRQTRTEWHRIKAYGKLADLFDQHLQRGSQISVVGAMRYRKWEDKYEQVRITAEVIAQNFTFLSPGKRATNPNDDEAELAAAMVADAEDNLGHLARKSAKRRGRKTTTVAA
ncbi:MAG: single-stranded DNA-binding protein [Bacteroidota bacterium]